MRKIVASTFLLVLLGAGCVNNLPFGLNFDSSKDVAEFPAEDVDFTETSALVIDQTVLGINVPNKEDYGKRHVTVDAWDVGSSTKLSWTRREYRETANSKVARQNAVNNVGVGETAVIPEQVFEDVTVTGSITTDALDNAERIFLPSYWPEGDYDVSGQQNSVLWLSRAQYDELASTRASHIQLGLFDSTLQGVLNFTDAAKEALDRLQGKIAASETTNKDFTKLTAQGDWGNYVLDVNGSQFKVKTIEASNAFASYTILANPQNPLILKVTLRPWALGPMMFTSLNELKSLVGYRISSIGTNITKD